MKNLQGWMILGIACLAGCVGTTIPVQAQQTATAIVVKERLVEHVGDRLIIDNETNAGRVVATGQPEFGLYAADRAGR